MVDAFAGQIDLGAEEVVETVEQVVEQPVAAPRALRPRGAQAPVAAQPVVTSKPGVREEIAIIGMAGQFPKATDIDTFWDNLVSGVDGVEELPANYLDIDTYWTTEKTKGKTRCKWGGVLTERDCFDPLFFNLSPKEAESMNPHQRLIMQESWKALEDAGYSPKALSGSLTGVFIGAEPSGYIGNSFTGLSDAIIASRLSYVMDFNGPAFVVNTGCSASAVAIHLACESLDSGESTLALAGGVNASMDQHIQLRLDEIDMLSPSGRCFTFDEAGDGTIICEGVGMVVLKRLSEAVADNDAIHGVLAASGLNQDGASNGITAPSGAAQERLIVETYERFGINPEDISYVEAHGTGTKLGDPIETNALVRAFGRFTDKQNYCSVGSSKSHIGHAAAAAGVIGLIKVLMSMRHQQIPALLNFKNKNPLVEFDGSPFYINTQQSQWQSVDGKPRMAAINSFGHSGTNAHMVVREHLAEAQAPATQSGPWLIALSAKAPEQLTERAEQLLKCLNNQQPDMTAMAYTLQVGREAMEERLALVAGSAEDLKAKLQSWLAGNSGNGIHQGHAKHNNELLEALDADRIEAWLAANDTEELAKYWSKGLVVDWSRLYDAQVGRIHLPVYPFAKERYWLDQRANQVLPGQAGLKAAAAPAAPAAKASGNIEDILDRIADDSLGAVAGAQLLKSLV